MKTLLCYTITLFFLIDCYSQEKLAYSFPFKDGKIMYTDVIQVDSTLKDELYNRAKRWIIDSFNSGKDVIQLDNKETGEIITKGFFSAYLNVTSKYDQEVNVWQILRIQIKDTRFKYELYDFSLKYHVTNSSDVDSSLEEWISNWNKVIADKPKMTKSLIPGINTFLLSIDPKVKNQISSLVLAMKTKNKENW